MKSLIIFGTTEAAEIANYYFTKDSDYQVAAFTVDTDYMDSDIFCGLQVVPFEEVTKQYSPQKHDMFVALGYSSLNQIRKEKYLSAKSLGYNFANYVSSKATVHSNFTFGENCFILEDNTIQPFVRIGNNVTLWSGNHIGHHSVIHDHCFISSHVVISGGCEIGEACFIGVNATLRDHIKIGEKCVIGAGSLLLRDAEPEGVYSVKSTKRSSTPSGLLKRI